MRSNVVAGAGHDADPVGTLFPISRYLRARDWSVENATKMYTDTLQWRKEVDLKGLLEEHAAGKDPFEERAKVAESGWKMCESGGVVVRGWGRMNGM